MQNEERVLGSISPSHENEPGAFDVMVSHQFDETVAIDEQAILPFLRRIGGRQWRLGIVAALAASLIAAAGLSVAAESNDVGTKDAAKRRSFHAPVAIKADGSAEIGEIAGISGPLAEAVRKQLASLQFIPAQRGGVAVDSKTHVTGAVVLTLVNSDEYEIAVKDASVAPFVTHFKLPDYPVERCRLDKSGGVEMALSIDASGKLVDLRTVSSAHREFEGSVRKAVAQWKFAPMPNNDGAITLKVPFWFHPAGKDEVPQPFQCAAEPDQPRVAGQAGCIGVVDIYCSRIRTS